MDIAVSDKSQSKKVFRARKTMKMSDRQQLESIHNSHSSSELPSSSSTSSSVPPSPIVMNGKYKEEQLETENGRESHTDKNPKETRSTPPVSRSPSPLTLSLTLSPSPPSKTPELRSNCNVLSTSAHSPNSVGKESDTKRGDNKEGINESSLMVEGETTDDKKEEKSEGTAGSGVKDKEDDLSLSLDSLQDPTISPVSPLASERKEEENQNENDDRIGSVGAVAMDTDSALMDAKVLEVNKPSPAVDTTSSSSPCFSPSHAPESDQEVKEGFWY
ncbi:hypothetical protein AGOR_G00199030 [Albula goreensis]|uniref:Uncharacterized protein n=1 Tax=Albula goreensis TaxID=1534307 RepID=A0A8T3CS16_9TELE|nr:hypothetical protein AGOR_G00199030 [Albula goreensis]